MLVFSPFSFDSFSHLTPLLFFAEALAGSCVHRYQQASNSALRDNLVQLAFSLTLISEDLGEKLLSRRSATRAGRADPPDATPRAASPRGPPPPVAPPQHGPWVPRSSASALFLCWPVIGPCLNRER